MFDRKYTFFQPEGLLFLGKLLNIHGKLFHDQGSRKCENNGFNGNSLILGILENIIFNSGPRFFVVMI